MWALDAYCPILWGSLAKKRKVVKGGHMDTDENITDSNPP